MGRRGVYIRCPDAAPRLGGGKKPNISSAAFGKGWAGWDPAAPPLPPPSSSSSPSQPRSPLPASRLPRRGRDERRGRSPPPPPRRQAMDDIPGLVKISVSLKIQPNDGAVYFKVDGQRFGQNRTIKLLTGAKYKIEVALRPGTVQAT